MMKKYKSLAEKIVSGYIYTKYDNLTIEYFEKMDIVYCAFLLFNDDGSLKDNKEVLFNIKNYVVPNTLKTGTYVILSIGGGGEMPRIAFSNMAKNKESRKNLIQNIIDIVNEYHLDGVDIDWETPTFDEKELFTLFTKELYVAVKNNNPSHLVTAAIAGGRWQPPRYDLLNSEKYLNYINVMTYDMSCSDGNYHNSLFPRREHHDPINKVGNTLESCSIEETIHIYNKLGVLNNKLIFGLPFYGITQELQNNQWVRIRGMSYTKISKHIYDKDFEYIYDEVSKVPYLISFDKTKFVSFDDPNSILEKSIYIKSKGCAGLMYWENGQDETGTLVDAMYKGLKL